MGGVKEVKQERASRNDILCVGLESGGRTVRSGDLEL